MVAGEEDVVPVSMGTLSHRTLQAVIEESRCAATPTWGQRCGSRPVFGAPFCRAHGGTEIITMQEARMRLQGMLAPALARLQWILDDPRSELQSVVRVTRDILDRCGLKPVDKFEFSGVVGILKQEDLERLSVDQLERLAEAARVLAGLGGRDTPAETVQDQRLLSGDGAVAPGTLPEAP